ncbi:MAG TPA: helix-hairpin-helix domain-containing protein [Acidimicrobiales bacterium]|nr:helix-hairpin-helix domain-containing protein [Acidimicrobiales bacterium]
MQIPPWLAAWRDRVPAPLAAATNSIVAASLAVAAVVAVVVVGVLVWRGPPPPAEASMPRATPTASSAGNGDVGPPAPTGPVIVHAAGAVQRPGLYRLRAGARVADLIDAAGGPTADADVDQLNLAALLTDGERIHVPRRGEAVSEPTGGAAAAGAVVDLNTATLEQLDSLPGVGPSTARAILEYRKSHGRFRSVRDLLDVRGIGEAKFAELKSRVRV